MTVCTPLYILVIIMLRFLMFDLTGNIMTCMRVVSCFYVHCSDWNTGCSDMGNLLKVTYDKNMKCSFTQFSLNPVLIK